MLDSAVRPVDVGVDAERVSCIDEAEEVDAAGARALEIEAAVELVFAAESLVETESAPRPDGCLSTGVW
jgi:hypothetical protein